jgi:hypothetical protein
LRNSSGTLFLAAGAGFSSSTFSSSFRATLLYGVLNITADMNEHEDHEDPYPDLNGVEHSSASYKDEEGDSESRESNESERNEDESDSEYAPENGENSDNSEVHPLIEDEE